VPRRHRRERLPAVAAAARKSPVAEGAVADDRDVVLGAVIDEPAVDVTLEQMVEDLVAGDAALRERRRPPRGRRR